MKKLITGSIYRVKDDVNTDEIIPARYCVTTDLDSLGAHALEDLHLGKSMNGQPFTPGKYAIIIAGKNFGCGSSREFAPVALQKAGVECVIAESFAPIFLRNSVNCGLPISTNLDLLRDEGFSVNLEDDAFWENFPPLYRKIIETGGLTAFNRSGTSYEVPQIPSRSMTLAEKVIAKACSTNYVEPGMIVMPEVARVVTHELTLPVSAEMMYKRYGNGYKINNPEKILFVADHTIQIPLIRNTSKPIELVEKAKVFIEYQGLKNAFLPPKPHTSQGICHVLFPEKGFIQPDTLVVGTDSHSCTYGAYGCLAFGIGNVDLVEIMVSGKILLEVPKSIKVKLIGKLPQGVFAKDLILHLLGKVSANGFKNCVVEFEGDALDTFTEQDRSTISNMTVEGGAFCGIFPVGQLVADNDASYVDFMEFDISNIPPLVAAPFSPDNVVSADSEDLDLVKIDVGWVGSCTGGKFEDIEAVAKVLEKHVGKVQARLVVSPATLTVYQKAQELGYLEIIKKAGGEIVPPGCGACIGMGPGTLKKGEIGIFASNRNFKGRTGLGETYLASPATVAASALMGRITDPRELLREGGI